MSHEEAKVNWRELRPTELDWVRLAAYIDGEGSVLINERNGRGDSNWGSYVRVVVANTDPRLPMWLRTTFGGTVSTQRKTNPKHRTAFKWHVSCRQAKWVLENVLSYLLLKREQAEIALAYQATLKGPGHRRTDAVLQQRQQYRERLREFNRRGIPREDPGTNASPVN